MTATNHSVRIIDAANTAELQSLLGADHIEFIKNLGQPTWITLHGNDQSRSRAIVTLLHANEPSGLKAIHKILKEGVTPPTNLGIFVASVEAALHPPIFSHRYLPNETDMNRCFGLEGKTRQEQLANHLVEILSAYQPEAIIDTHNTSAHSEPFAVAVSSDSRTRQVSQLFTRKLVVLGQTLGTLIEQELGCPVVTVEFGGFLDPNADNLALSSLERFVSTRHLFDIEPVALQVLQSPLRLEVQPDAHLHYSTTVRSEGDITILNTIDQLNFRQLKADTTIGWISKSGINQLVVKNQKEQNIAKKLFVEDAGFLKTRAPMTVFMATTDNHIARHDCLMYLCLDAPLPMGT
ncbi:MAG: hypothetical protein ACJA0W_002546 [Candidatus Azotimanducaceae bacterium]|jgi:hypothetical protein